MFTTNRQFEAALQVIGDLRAAGHEAYLAGGCVRDLLLGRAPKDFDVATSATPAVVLGLFPRTFAVGAHFGVVLVADGDDEGYIVTEVATFRSDGVYSDGRHPDAVKYTLSAEEDVKRRDFTVNGLLLDPFCLEKARSADSPRQDQGGLSTPLRGAPDERTSDVRVSQRPYGAQDLCFGASQGGASLALGYSRCLPPGGNAAFLSSAKMNGALQDAQEGSISTDDSLVAAANDLRAAVIDHVGGLTDLDAGVVRAIGRPELRFEEDHLRMLRGVRFAARFGFELDPATAAAMRRLAAKTAAVSRERVRDELSKMLTEGHARRAFELLDQTGLLQEVLPEIARTKGVEQPAQFHPEGDVWTHTLLLLDQLEAGCPLTLAWGALLHDVGKPPTFRRAPDRIRFDGHVEMGVAMGAEICRRFRFSNDESHQILALIENHMRFADAARMRASTLKRFFRLESFEEHLALHKMDCLAASGNLDHWNHVRERYEAMPEEVVRPQPLITGRELIAAGYTPGAGFKQMLRTVEDAQLEGLIGTAEEALGLVRERFPIL